MQITQSLLKPDPCVSQGRPLRDRPANPPSLILARSAVISSDKLGDVFVLLYCQDVKPCA